MIRRSGRTCLPLSALVLAARGGVPGQHRQVSSRRAGHAAAAAPRLAGRAGDNGFRLSAANLAQITLDPGRMKLAPGEVRYSVTTDGPLEISLGKSRLGFGAAGAHEGSLRLE